MAQFPITKSNTIEGLLRYNHLPPIFKHSNICHPNSLSKTQHPRIPEHCNLGSQMKVRLNNKTIWVALEPEQHQYREIEQWKKKRGRSEEVNRELIGQGIANKSGNGNLKLMTKERKQIIKVEQNQVNKIINLYGGDRLFFFKREDPLMGGKNRTKTKNQRKILKLVR